MELPPRNNVLGVGISVLDLISAADFILKCVQEGMRGYVTITGVHGVMESQKDEELKRIHNNSLLSTPDGMPMVWLGKKNGHSTISRVYGPDLMLEVFKRGVASNCRHFLYGGKKGVVEKLSSRLSMHIPNATIVGLYTPPFHPLSKKEESDLRDQLASVQADVIWVGLSTPKQERFMAQYIEKLPVKVMIGVGAAFDFHAGLIRQAPKWMQKAGCEWFFRLLMEPKRLWKRYLFNNTSFLWLIMKQELGFKQFPAIS